MPAVIAGGFDQGRQVLCPDQAAAVGNQRPPGKTVYLCINDAGPRDQCIANAHCTVGAAHSPNVEKGSRQVIKLTSFWLA